MKRQKLHLIAITVLVLSVFGWLASSSHRISVEESKILEASKALRFGNVEQADAGRKTLEDYGSRAVDILARQVTRSEGLMQRMRRKIAPLFPVSLRAKIRRVLPARDPATERLSAIDALELFGTNAATAVPLLERTLSDPQSPIAWSAASALAKVGPSGLPPMIRALQDPNASVRLAACYGLGIAGSNAAPAVSGLTNLLGDPDLRIRLAAQDALLRIGPESVTPLAQAALIANEHVRTGAVHVLQIFQSDTRSAVPILLAGTGAPLMATRSFAARALGRLVPADTNMVEALTRLLNDSEDSVRLEAVLALKQCGVRAAPAVPQLTNLLRDSSADVREAVAATLARLGSLAKPALPELEKRLHDPVQSVRNSASNSIAAIQAASPPPAPR